jgi:hypothetical protein
MKGYNFKFEITADMIHNKHLKGNHLLVYALIDHYTKVNGYYILSAQMLADILNLNVNTVYNCISSLCGINHLIESEKVITEDERTILKLRTL